jgi:DNA-binding MarR family transcriptional regulator
MSSELGTGHANASDSPGLLLWRVSTRWAAAQREALAHHDLTHTQFVLLASLLWLRRGRDEPVTQRELADFAGTDVMMTSQVLRTLESKGMVERRVHPSDARARDLVVTEAGARVTNQAIPVVEQVDREFFAAAGEHQAGLLAALKALASHERDRQ